MPSLKACMLYSSGLQAINQRVLQTSKLHNIARCIIIKSLFK